MKGKFCFNLVLYSYKYHHQTFLVSLLTAQLTLFESVHSTTI